MIAEIFCVVENFHCDRFYSLYFGLKYGVISIFTCFWSLAHSWMIQIWVAPVFLIQTRAFSKAQFWIIQIWSRTLFPMVMILLSIILKFVCILGKYKYINISETCFLFAFVISCQLRRRWFAHISKVQKIEV